jgi:hypothetical protein
MDVCPLSARKRMFAVRSRPRLLWPNTGYAAEAGHDNKPKTAALFARNIYCARRFDCFPAMHPEQLNH